MMPPSPVHRSFFLDEDVVGIAQRLLGHSIHTYIDGEHTAGIITETEAYAGTEDRASHAFGGRRTQRTEPMYADGGTAYVYLCYGIHHLFNVVTGPRDHPHAVLLRAMVPWIGHTHMAHRRGRKDFTTHGPGTLAQALGIRTEHSGTDLVSGPVRIQDIGIRIHERDVTRGPRIGVEYAGADALLPYRFRIAPSRLKQLNAELYAGA